MKAYPGISRKGGVNEAVGKKYDEWLSPEGLKRLEGWARDGLTLKQIAGKCRCSLQTLRKWEQTFPPIAEALRKGLQNADVVPDADGKVEHAVWKSAVGYEYIESITEVGEKERTVETKKHAKPNMQAAKFWLSHRKPDQWGDQPKETETEAGGCIVLPEVNGDV